ncbi:hypothetical protein OHS59_01385 [Streptomyces sp. NBC_00414]|uniref:hypothetical protein n=1 Tax=Streptomyces sp. NBC_00414 TaxID=2975739 RepID=UPI002E24E952
MTAIGRLAARMAPLPPATSRRVQVERGLKIPMDDGATLVADHRAPRDTVRDVLGPRHDVGFLKGLVCTGRTARRRRAVRPVGTRIPAEEARHRTAGLFRKA